MRKVTKYRVFTGYGYEDKIYILCQVRLDYDADTKVSVGVGIIK